MRNVCIRKFIGLAVAFILTLSFSTSALAAKETTDSSQIFKQDELARHIKNARNKKVYNDFKTKGKEETTSLVAANSTGTYPTRTGVILVTEDKYKGIIPTGHAAIIWTANTVVESLSKGVTTGPNDWNTTRNTCYGVTVKGTTAAQDSAASNWCYSQKGKAYNYNYLNKDTRSKFYCSQLVYAAFLDNYGINIDTSAFITAIHPIEIVESGNTTIIYEK